MAIQRHPACYPENKDVRKLLSATTIRAAIVKSAVIVKTNQVVSTTAWRSEMFHYEIVLIISQKE